VTCGAGLYKNKYLCKAVPRAGLNRVFWSVKACFIYLSLLDCFPSYPLVMGGKKKAGGHFEKWNVVFCFSKCLPKSYAK
jgi:hypothetical protein